MLSGILRKPKGKGEILGACTMDLSLGGLNCKGIGKNLKCEEKVDPRQNDKKAKSNCIIGKVG